MRRFEVPVLLILFLLACEARPPARTVPVDDPPLDSALDAEPPASCPCPRDFDAAALWRLDSGPDVAMGPPGGPTRDELLVFLHGSDQSPSHHAWILQTAAYAGYRTLGLQYTSNPDTSDICRDGYPEEEWPACGDSGHRAKIYGAEHDDYIFVPDEASIVGRLYERLVALHAADPAGGWDAYFEPAPAGVTDHERYLRFDRMVLSGFSQGGGHAAFLAIDHPVDGVVLMSGPPDPNVYLDWVRPGATPACAWLGFRHEAEDYAAYIGENWDLVGIPGADTPIEPPLDACWSEWPAFDGAQRWVSSLPHSGDPACAGADKAHGSMANDVCLNIADAPPGDPYALFRHYLYAFCRAGELDSDGAGGCTTP